MTPISLLDKFTEATRKQPDKDNHELLLAAYDTINIELKKSNYAIEDVKLAEEIYGLLGDEGLNDRVHLMRRFLQLNPDDSNENKFWARWNLVDNLALLKRYKEMIEEQRAFLKWAMDHMEPSYWIKVMDDSTQALGWYEEQCSEEWFDIYYNLITRVEPSDGNRHRRVLLVETATSLLLYNLKKYRETENEINRYHTIIHEDTTWDEYKKFLIRLKVYELGLYSAKSDWENYDKAVDEATSIIAEDIENYNKGAAIEIEEICDMAHEIGTCLMWDGKYEQAIPLFQYAIDHQGAGVTHYFYAMCIWATSKNRDETLHHLKVAEHTAKGNQGLRSRYIHMFLETKEFEEVKNDKQFLSVFKL